MRVLATTATCVALWVSLAATALAQGAAAPPASPPDVPAGEARITGRVVHRDDPERGIAGIEVALYALSEDGNPGLRGAKSDERGAFTFDGISPSPRIAYFVGARYGGVPFPGARVVFSPGETERAVEVPVSELRSEADDIAIPQVTLQLDWRGRELLVSESVELHHAYPETLFVPAEDRDAKPPFASIPVPADARNLEYPFGVAPEGVERREDALAFFGPLHPGEPQAVRFGYAFGSGGDTLALEFPVPEGSARVELLVPANGPEAETTLRREGPVEIADRQYIRYVAEASEASQTVLAAFTLPDASTDGSRARVATAQWVVDVDAALLSLREEYVLEVSGQEPIVAPPGEVLLRLALPGDAQELRFGSDAAGVELIPHEDGGLGVLGPLPPGQSTISLRYGVPVVDGETLLERRFAQHQSLLSVYVTDDGRTSASSPRLHRRRPVRTADRNYIHLEGFEIEAGESVELRIAALAPRASLPRPAFLVGLGLATFGVVALVSAPLLRGSRGLSPNEESAAEREHAALVASLRDLEHDFETGKISAEDHGRLRAVLRRRALATQRGSSELEEAPEAAPEGSMVGRSETPSCPACGAPVSVTARFCDQCGAALAPENS